MVFIYTLLIRVYGFAIQVAGLFNEKARWWSRGRRDLFSRLSTAISGKQHWIWIHVSSLGEFEQGRPLIEMLHARHPEYGILLTFYSPSGYLIRKDYDGADYVTYMPLDTPGKAQKFVEIAKPVLAVFVKYDIWYHHLRALEKAAVPAFLISAQLRPDQIYFKPWGHFLLDRLLCLAQIFTQTGESTSFLRSKGMKNITQAGDTRLDRVLKIATSGRDYVGIRACLPEGPVLIAGSTWPEDESRLFPAVRDLQLPAIIAPHEISERRLSEIEQFLPGAVRLSALRSKPQPVRYVIVDTMGELAFLYTLGSMAYVGGGFGKGIHNILEPVAHGLPVLIGPRFEKFAEAVILKGAGVVQAVHSVEDIRNGILKVSDRSVRDAVHAAINEYIEVNRGATELIYSAVKGYL